MAAPARYETRSDGYCRWRAWDRVDGRERYVYVHQLTAIADGASPYLVFSAGEYHIHHRSGIRFDNRPSNPQLLKGDDHARETFDQEGAES
ncbi:hypothetical protein [Halorussus marinus]|uniref:hypothetical protein n=1 Tax=Halorussus marinus TaxID=2505976 RepID=UPI001091EFE2|nr:hypothetical protein [Halorussus marinus]